MAASFRSSIAIKAAAILVNQLLGSPIDGSVQRIYLRIEGEAPVEIVGPGANIEFGAGPDSFIWAGESLGVSHRVALFLEPDRPAWIWRVEIENRSDARAMDVVLIQDIGLGGRGFLMNNEAYVSQYIDHFVAPHPRCGPSS